jgi:aspyridone synthetase trans-acting enoyl reductase
MIATHTIPPTHTALKIVAANEVSVVDTPLPILEPSDILVHVACVSINHVDAKSADMSPSPGATSGTDFAGVIVAIGSNVQKDKFRIDHGIRPVQIGDRVFGGVFGNNPLRKDNGAFAEYVAVPARLVWHIPDNMSYSTASTLGAAVATVGLSLFQYMQLPMLPATITNDSGDGPFALVYGGGTATGAMAIQVFKVAGFRPIATCSLSSATRATELGAVATFDYHSPTCGMEIREYTNDTLTLALDCITDTASMNMCYESLGTAGGRYVALDSFPLRCHTRRSVTPDWVCTYSQFGHPIAWAPPYDLDARPEDLELAEAWYMIAQRLIDEGRILPHLKEERTGGLAAIADGMQAVRRGEIKGKKLVYAITKELRLGV